MFGPKRRVLCIDWDRRDLRIVVRLPNGNIQLQDAHSVRIPASVDITDPQAMGTFIQQTLRARGMGHKYAILDVPREDAVINRLVIPPTPFEELAAAVRFRAMQELPFPMETASVDFLIMKRDEKGLATEVLLAAVPLESLDRLRQTCVAAGLTPERIGLRPYANLTAAKELHGTGEKRVLFVDVGPQTTEINVIHGDELAFTRSASVAVSHRDTEPVGSKQDSQILTLVPPSDDEVDATDAATVQELLVEVTRTLQAFRAMESEATIEAVVISGRTGLEEALRVALDERLGLPTELFDPTQRLGAGPEHAESLLRFSAVLGLAWSAGHARQAGDTLDFLNPKRPQPPRASLKRRIRVAAIAASVVVGLLAIILGTQYYRLSSQLSRLKAANSEQAAKLKKQYELLDYIEMVNEEWAREWVWPDALKVLTEEAIEPGTQMVVDEIAMDRPTGTISVRGLLASNYTVPKRYVENLRNYEFEGQHVLGPKQMTWSDLSEEQKTDKFKGKVDVIVNLLPIQQHDRDRKKREDARKERIKGL